ASTAATPSVTGAGKNTTPRSVSSTRHGSGPRMTTGTAAAATNSSLKHQTESTQGTAATSASAGSSTPRAGPSTRSRRQTAATGSPTATTNTTTHAGTQTAPTSPASTVRPRPTPQPSDVPTGTYTLSDGNGTCVKAVMGLQLMARSTQQAQMEYVTVNPNMTKVSGSCGMVQSELNLTFIGGFVNFTFVK
ncbi:LAMP3 protein, partial [Bombycilla garrulus]|nr:LAMP3 protein [Bombycilla garrulus]